MPDIQYALSIIRLLCAPLSALAGRSLSEEAVVLITDCILVTLQNIVCVLSFPVFSEALLLQI